jgi:hypothetical protein
MPRTSVCCPVNSNLKIKTYCASEGIGEFIGGENRIVYEI